MDNRELEVALADLLAMPVGRGEIVLGEDALAETGTLRETLPLLIGIAVKVDAEGEKDQSRRVFDGAFARLQRWIALDRKGLVGLMEPMVRISGERAVTGHMVYLVAKHFGERQAWDIVVTLMQYAVSIGADASLHKALLARAYFAQGDNDEGLQVLFKRWRRVPQDPDLEQLFAENIDELRAYEAQVDDEAEVESALRAQRADDALIDYLLGRADAWPRYFGAHGAVFQLLVDKGIPNDHEMMKRLLRGAVDEDALDELRRGYMSTLDDVAAAHMHSLRFLELTGLSSLELVCKSVSDYEVAQSDGLRAALAQYLLPSAAEGMVERLQQSTHGYPANTFCQLLLASDRHQYIEVVKQHIDGRRDDVTSALPIVDEPAFSCQQHQRIVQQWLKDSGAKDTTSIPGYIDGDLDAKRKWGVGIDKFERGRFFTVCLQTWHAHLEPDRWQRARAVAIDLSPVFTLERLTNDFSLDLASEKLAEQIEAPRFAHLAALVKELVSAERLWKLNGPEFRWDEDQPEPHDESLSEEERESMRAPSHRRGGLLLRKMIESDAAAVAQAFTYLETESQHRLIELAAAWAANLHRDWLVAKLKGGRAATRMAVAQALPRDSATLEWAENAAVNGTKKEKPIAKKMLADNR